MNEFDWAENYNPLPAKQNEWANEAWRGKQTNQSFFISSTQTKKVNFLFYWVDSFIHDWIDEIKKYYNSTVIRAGKDSCFQNGWMSGNEWFHESESKWSWTALITPNASQRLFSISLLFRMGREIERRESAEGGLGRSGKVGLASLLFSFCGLRAQSATAPQKKRQASQEAKAACLFISLSRFCWRNETKAKRKKRVGWFGLIDLLWVMGGATRQCSATKEASPTPNQQR